jgi:hypothetical protein
VQLFERCGLGFNGWKLRRVPDAVSNGDLFTAADGVLRSLDAIDSRMGAKRGEPETGCPCGAASVG